MRCWTLTLVGVRLTVTVDYIQSQSQHSGQWSPGGVILFSCSISDRLRSRLSLVLNLDILYLPWKCVCDFFIMYTLLYGLYKYLVQKDEYCVLILGLDNAGKTTYLEAAKTKFTKNYKAMNPSKITTTVGLNIGKIEVAGIRLNFWDLGGQEELQSLWDKYYAESHALIYIVDSSDRERIPESKETFDKMISSENLIGVPLLVLANKQDIPDCMGVREVKPIFNKNAHLIGRRDCMVMPVSALNGDGVDEGIRWLVDCIKRNSEIRPPKDPDDT